MGPPVSPCDNLLSLLYAEEGEHWLCHLMECEIVHGYMTQINYGNNLIIFQRYDTSDRDNLWTMHGDSDNKFAHPNMNGDILVENK